MTSTEIDAVLLSGIITCIGGFYALFTGFKFVRSPDRIRPMYFQLGVEIVRVLQGKEAADKREVELMNSAQIHRHGYLRILTGSLLILGGCFQLIGLALL